MTEKDTPGLGLEGWLSKFSEATTGIKKGETLDPNRPMDDLTKMRWLMAIDQRYMLAKPKTCMGRANEKVVQDLEEIRADYERLLRAGLPQRPFYTEEALREKIADVLRSTAVTYEFMRDYSEARRYFTAAAQSYGEIGKAEQAQRYQDDLVRMRFDQEGNVDDEIQRLHRTLSTLPEGTIGHAQALIDLGSLYSNNGDDYEAKELLLEAEQELKAIKVDPSGRDLATALEQSLLGIYQGQHTSRPTPIETAMQMNGLYRLLYLSLARIYEAEDPQTADDYRKKAAQRDSRDYNDEFSKAMLQALAGELGKLL